MWSVSLRLVGGEQVQLTSDDPNKLDATVAELARAIKEARAAWIAGQRGSDVEEGEVQRGER